MFSVGTCVRTVGSEEDEAGRPVEWLRDAVYGVGPFLEASRLALLNFSE